MAGLSTGAGAPVVNHEKSMILPDVSRVLACLYEKDVKFETVKASYKDILRLQATRSVPVPFYDGPIYLQESRAICRYIAETYEHRGYPFLLGKDVLERASIEQWLRHEEHAFDPPSRALFCHLAFPLHDEDIDDIDREKRKLEEVLEVYEQRLGECEFLAGNNFTLADLVHLPNTHHLVTSEKFAYLYDSRKNVQRWWNTISARDSWQQVVRNMEIVEEQYQMEELEQQEQLLHQQWHTEPPPTSGGRTIRIDPRKQSGSESRTILVPPPSDGTISSSFFTAQQEEHLPAKTSHGEPSPIKREESNFFTTTEKTSSASKQKPSTTQKSPRDVHSTTSSFFTSAQQEEHLPAKTSHGEPSPIKREESNFFTTTEKTSSASKQKPSTTQKSPRDVHSTTSSFFTSATPPTTTKMTQRTDTDKSTSKDTSSPNRTRQRSSKEAPNKLHLSDFYKASSHPDEAATLASPSPQKVSKTTDEISVTRQRSEVVAPDKPDPASAKADIYETERKPASVDPGAGDTPFDQTSVVQTPYAEQPPKQAKKASADQRAAAHLPEHVAAKDVQGGTAPQARHRDRDAKDITKEAREADRNGATSAPTKGLPSGSQYTPQQSKAPPTDLKVSDLPPLQEEYEDTQGAMDGDERFSTKRLRKMLEQSDPAALKSQSTDLQAPPKQEETPPVYNKPAHVQDRKGQADNISADGRTGSTPSTGARDPDTPSSGDERRATSPTKGGIAPDDRGATEPRKSPSINEREPTQPVPSQSPTTRASHASPSSNGAAQDDDLAQLSTIDQWRGTSTPPRVKQGAPGAPSIDKLDKTTGVDRRAQTSTTKKTSIEQSDKTTMDERGPEMTRRQAPPSDTRRTSAPAPPSQKQVSSSQKTTEPIRGVTPTSYGITGDESANIAMADESATPPALPQAPASDGRSVSTALQGSTLDARRKNDAVKPSIVDPRGMPTTPKRPPTTPDTQRHTTSDETSDQAPPLPPFAATGNEKTRIAETSQTTTITSQTTTIAPDEQPGERALKNTRAPAARPLPMKSREDMDEAYSDRASTQQLSSDQSRAQSAENKKKQGGDATLVTEFGESKEDDFVANSKQNNTAQAQVTSTDGSSKQQKQSDQNKPISSKDISNETDRSSATTRDMLPSVLEKSMGKQLIQDDRSSVSPQDNEKQGSEAAPPVSKTEQSKKRGQALPKSEEQTSPDTQQVENNTSGRKSDGSSKPSQFDGNEGDVPESQKGGSSTNP